MRSQTKRELIERGPTVLQIQLHGLQRFHQNGSQVANIFPRLVTATELTGGRSRRIGKTFSGFAGIRVGFQEAIGVGQFQDTVNHSRGAGETKGAAGGFQTGETIYEFSQPTTVELGQLGQIEDHADLAVAEQLIERQLELFALDSNLERSGQL
jgi:hypothetical protein